MHRVLAASVAGVLLLVLGSPAVADVDPLPVDTDVDYQLGGPKAMPAHVGILVRDRRAAPAEGRYNVCYVNGFQTQPDERRFWKQRMRLVLRRDGRPVVDEAWGEWLLDIRTKEKRRALARIAGRWTDRCASDGFDAVEYDNLDSFTRSHGLLERRHAIAYARLLVRRAHAADLAVGQKNLAGFDGSRIEFDFAVAEECALPRVPPVRRVVRPAGPSRRVPQARLPARLPDARRRAGDRAARSRAQPRRDPAVVLSELHTTSMGEKGSPIVFCHGLFGQGRNWTQIGKALAGEHRILLVDLPHHGRSPWADHFDYLDIADQVAELLSTDDPVTLVGHSMGGKVAMVLALRHPALVERLCIVDVAPVAYDHMEEFAGYIEALQGLDLEGLSQRGDADTALEEAVPNPTVRGFLLQNLRRDGEGWRWQVNLEVLGENLEAVGGWPEERLAELTAYPGQVLWVGGENSHYVRGEYADAMGRWFPHNRRVTVKGAGHWVHSEQPQVLVEVLRRFVD